MSIARLLDRAARIAPTLAAVSYGARELHTFGALKARAEALAGHLARDRSLAPGARVLVMMDNVPEYPEVLFGIWKAGGAAVPIHAKLHAREVAYMLEHADVAVAFATPNHGATLSQAARIAGRDLDVIETGGAAYRSALTAAPADLRPEAAPDDLAWLFYTSGTTGRPKGAMITHRNLLAMTTSYFVDVDTIAPGDGVLHAAPMSHGSGLYILPHVAGLAQQIIPESGGFDAGEILGLVGAHAGVAMFAAPTMVNRLVAHPGTEPGNLAGLKTIVYGGAPMHVADVIRARAALGPRLAQIYGQGESPMCITALPKRCFEETSHPRYEALIGSAGFPQAVVEVAILGPDDRPLPEGEVGEVCVRGEAVCAGYWRDDAATSTAMRAGWLHTGDVGLADRDGFITLLDRSKDFIISGGSNIYPREVEEVVLRHPAVAEVSVVGRPHPDWGEEVVAFVAVRPGLSVSEAELDALCRDNIARFKRPKLWRFLPELPKNSTGKILKRELREALVREASDAPEGADDGSDRDSIDRRA